MVRANRGDRFRTWDRTRLRLVRPVPAHESGVPSCPLSLNSIQARSAAECATAPNPRRPRKPYIRESAFRLSTPSYCLLRDLRSSRAITSGSTPSNTSSRTSSAVASVDSPVFSGRDGAAPGPRAGFAYAPERGGGRNPDHRPASAAATHPDGLIDHGTPGTRGAAVFLSFPHTNTRARSRSRNAVFFALSAVFRAIRR